MSKALSTAWDIIRKPDSTSQVALAIASIFWITVAGAVVVAIYGFAARNCGFGCRVAGSLLGVVCGASAFSVGGMLGLLFGAPSWNGSGEAGTPSDTVAGNGDEKSNGQVRPNSRLDRVAEWLTTMIVGLSLVNLPAIQIKATEVGIWVTRAITNDPATLNGSAGVMLAISFAFAGFTLVYLWSLRFLPSEIRNSYSELRAVVAQADKSKSQLNEVISYTKQVFADFKNKPIFLVPEYALKQSLEEMRQAQIDDATCAEVVSRYGSVSKGIDEPMRAFGAASQDGCTLSASVEDQGAGNYLVVIELTVPPQIGATCVFWLLHNSFTPGVIHECPVEHGVAKYSTTVQESFWIGAAVPRAGAQAIRLSFDLGLAHGATDAFKTGDPNPAGTVEPPTPANH